jgi:drug/metabolite transporter (DMT)-like permease
VDYILYLFLSYLAGALVLLPWALCQGSIGLGSLAWGGGAAVSSYAGVYCTLKSLESLPPQVVFPISLSGPIILGVVLSQFLCRESIRRAGWAGVLFAVAGITVLAIWK